MRPQVISRGAATRALALAWAGLQVETSTLGPKLGTERHAAWHLVLCQRDAPASAAYAIVSPYELAAGRPVGWTASAWTWHSPAQWATRVNSDGLLQRSEGPPPLGFSSVRAVAGHVPTASDSLCISMNSAPLGRGKAHGASRKLPRVRLSAEPLHLPPCQPSPS